jgi:hypothetical protein
MCNYWCRPVGLLNVSGRAMYVRNIVAALPFVAKVHGHERVQWGVHRSSAPGINQRWCSQQLCISISNFHSDCRKIIWKVTLTVRDNEAKSSWKRTKCVAIPKEEEPGCSGPWCNQNLEDYLLDANRDWFLSIYMSKQLWLSTSLLGVTLSKMDVRSTVAAI